MALAVLVPPSVSPSAAGSGDRTLYFHHTHTGLTQSFTFKHNGEYDQRVLSQLNIFLADWRTKQVTHMDPALFDLIWQIYNEVGASQPINIVSAYRAPETNAMLRARSSAVAEHSQHILGRAMDIFIPGISLAKLREASMRHQVGGVGYYPTSGSPFVHVDTGGVRAWPRMTRAQLKKVFPDGRTLHLPADGTPLSQSGRQFAMAQWNKCHQVPCNGAVVPAFDQGGDVQVASLDPTQRNVTTFAVSAPVPLMRPATFAMPATAALTRFDNPSAELAPIPLHKPATLVLASLSVSAGETALAALDEIGAPLPKPRLLMTPGDQQLVTAYVPASPTDEGAQRALEMIIERETTASLPAQLKPLPAPSTLGGPEIRTALLGADKPANAFGNMFDLTWSAVSAAGSPRPISAALADLAASRKPIMSLLTRDSDFVAPDMDHVTETMMTPDAMASLHYADLYEPEGYLDSGAELGPMANRIGLESDVGAPIPYDHFVRRAPLLVASR